MEPMSMAVISSFSALIVGFVIGRATMTERFSRGKVKSLESDLTAMKLSLESAKSELRNFKGTEEYREILQSERERGRREGEKFAIAQFKASEDFANLLAIEHERGKRSGAAEELEKFHITYTPVLVDVESFLSRKVDVGYDMQINYSGFPIGEPTRRITNHRQRSKDENIKNLLDTVGKTLELATEVAKKSGIPITIDNSPRRVGR